MDRDCGALVVGARSQLAVATALELRGRIDGPIVVSSRNGQVDEALLRGDFSLLYGCDLATEAGEELLREKVKELIPTAFVAVSCAGRFGGYSQVSDTSQREARVTLESNLLTFLSMARAVVPTMRTRGGGSLWAITSHSRHQGYPYMGLFEASKAGLAQLVRHIANEEGRFRISANCLAISSLDTTFEREHVRRELLVSPAVVARTLVDLVFASSPLISGNEIHAFKWDESYFEESFFSRRRIR